MADGRSDQVKGRMKQAAGDRTDNDDLRRSGERDEAGGKMKEAVDNAADKIAEGIDRAKEKVDDHD